MFRILLPALTSAALVACGGSSDSNDPQRSEHSVPVTSTAPSMTGQTAQLYVREIKPGDASAPPAVIFVHGSGTPAEVSFDSRMDDYSWMRAVAAAGFDVFSVSMTGYGGSTRPAPMSNPCNIQTSQQAAYVPTPCDPTFRLPITTMTSDWNDLGAVVDYVRNLRGVDRVSLVAWSQGGPRVTGYATLQPNKVNRIVVLAPAYNRTGLTSEPNPLPAVNNGGMSMQSRKGGIL